MTALYGIIIGLLRIIRFLCGLGIIIGISNCINTFSIISNASHLNADKTSVVSGLLAGQIIVSIIIIFIYLLLQKAINNMHYKRSSTDELLIKNFWHL